MRNSEIPPSILVGGGAPNFRVRRRKMKKVWEKPKLVGLVRGKPEERVLQVCKGAELMAGPDEDDCWVGGGLGYCEEWSRS